MSMLMSLISVVASFIAFIFLIFLILELTRKRRYINEEAKICAYKQDESGKHKYAMLFKVENVEISSTYQNRPTTKTFLIINLSIKNVCNSPTGLYDFNIFYKVGKKKYNPSIEGQSYLEPELSGNCKLLFEIPKEFTNGKLMIGSAIFYLKKKAAK